MWKICSWNSKHLEYFQNYWAKLGKEANAKSLLTVNKTKNLITNKINQKINIKENQNHKINQKSRNKPYELVELLNYMYRY